MYVSCTATSARVPGYLARVARRVVVSSCLVVSLRPTDPQARKAKSGNSFIFGRELHDVTTCSLECSKYALLEMRKGSENELMEPHTLPDQFFLNRPHRGL